MKLHRPFHLALAALMIIAFSVGLASAKDRDEETHTYKITSDDGESWTVVCNDGPSIFVTDEDGDTVVDLDLELDTIMEELSEGLEDLKFDIHFEEADLRAMTESMSDIAIEISAGLEEALEDLEFDIDLGEHNRVHVITDDSEFEVDLNEIMTELGSALETAFSEFSGDERRAHRRHYVYEEEIDDRDLDTDSLREELSELKKELAELRRELRQREKDKRD